MLRGIGEGNFDAVDQPPSPRGGSGVAVADFNEDGFADAVGSFLDDEVVGIFPGGAERAPGVPRSFAVGARPVAVLAVDVNVDEHADVVTLDAVAQISVLLGTGTGELGPVSHQALPALGKGFTAVDVDDDRDPDLFVVDVAPSLRLLLNDGAGTFAPLDPIT